VTAPRGANPWRGRVGLAALAVVLVTTAVKAVWVAGSFFNQDDYVAMAWVREYGFTWRYLTIEFAGHVNPGQRVLYWLVVHAQPMGWGPPALVIDVMVLLAAVLMWHVLVRLVGAGTRALVALVYFCVAPLPVLVSLWFGAALAVWPPIIFGLLAALFFLRGAHDARGGRLNLALVPVMVVLGLAFHERSLLIAPLVLAVAALAGLPEGPVWPWRVLRPFWGVWVSLTAVCGAFLVFYLRSVDSGVGVPTGASSNAGVVASFLGRAVAPGLVAGPWQASRDGGAVEPAPWVTVVSIAIVVLVLVHLVRRCGRAGRVAALVVLTFAALQSVVLLVSRGGFGSVIGLDPRYSADILLPVTLALAVGLRRDAHAAPAAGARRPAVLAGVLVLAALTTLLTLVPGGQNKTDRAFITSIRAALQADPRVVLIDRYVPAEIVIGAFGRYALLSEVLRPLPENPLFDVASDHLKVVDDDGRVLDPELLAPTVAVGTRRPGCGFEIRQEPRTLELRGPVQGSVLVSLEYFTDTAGTVDLRLGATQVEVPVREGANRVEVPVDLGTRPIRSVQLQADQFGGTALCLGQLTVATAGVP
jgi:hypothetical protein